MTIQYRVVHHVPGRIRIEVPSLKGVSFKALQGLSGLSLPGGIEDIRPNPITGSVLIRYNPAQINITAYLRDIAASNELGRIVSGEDPK